MIPAAAAVLCCLLAAGSAGPGLPKIGLVWILAAAGCIALGVDDA